MSFLLPRVPVSRLRDVTQRNKTPLVSMLFVLSLTLLRRRTVLTQCFRVPHTSVRVPVQVKLHTERWLVKRNSLHLHWLKGFESLKQHFMYFFVHFFVTFKLTDHQQIKMIKTWYKIIILSSYFERKCDLQEQSRHCFWTQYPIVISK